MGVPAEAVIDGRSESERWRPPVGLRCPLPRCGRDDVGLRHRNKPVSIATMERQAMSTPHCDGMRLIVFQRPDAQTGEAE